VIPRSPEDAAPHGRSHHRESTSRGASPFFSYDRMRGRLYARECADARCDTIFAAVGAFQPTLSYGCLTPTTERTFAGGSGPRMRSLRAPALAPQRRTAIFFPAD
jgi:hypothetical protein